MNQLGKTIIKASLLALLFVISAAANAQTPTPLPTPVNPATQPPGTEIQPPTAPPATQQPSPQAPPGAIVAPTPLPSPGEPSLLEPREPNFPNFQAQQLPPPPDLTRVGVISSNILTLSLNDAIRKALQNNNDIEVSRDDVRYRETQLRALYGFYDPIFSVTPQIINNITPQQSSLGGRGASGTTTTTTFNLSPSLTKTFEATGGNYTVSF